MCRCVLLCALAFAAQGCEALRVGKHKSKECEGDNEYYGIIEAHMGCPFTLGVDKTSAVGVDGVPSQKMGGIALSGENIT